MGPAWLERISVFSERGGPTRLSSELEGEEHKKKKREKTKTLETTAAPRNL